MADSDLEHDPIDDLVDHLEALLGSQRKVRQWKPKGIGAGVAGGDFHWRDYAQGDGGRATNVKYPEAETDWDIFIASPNHMTRVLWERPTPTNGLPPALAEETGMPGVGVMIWRRGEGRGPMWQGTVGEFLGRPDYQNGTWLIDGGWGGPPGPIEVDWIDGAWVDQGHLGERR